MSTVISVENVSKQYRLGQVGTGTLSHDVNRWWHKVRGKEDPYLKVGEANDRSKKGDSEYSWALRDVSFEVKHGAVLGIIGRNGAGKSTLLKILSRVTTPTTGEIKVKGRIASLLEVGTGFHPELTGRENIFLNGAILGMRKHEITRKLDEIIDFSGCERYIGTPVKRYSSGMYVRLAFAVAAHLEPEILIVDEVLAVGDTEFQKKCLGKMKDVAGQGRTVIFVSHQIPSVTRLCKEVLWMEKGGIHERGRSASVCSRYLAQDNAAASTRIWAHEACPGNEWVRMHSLEARSGDGQEDHFSVSRPVHISMIYEVLKPGKIMIPNIHFYTSDGTLIFVSHDWYSGWRDKRRLPGIYRSIFTVPEQFFCRGSLSITAAVSSYKPFEVHFHVTDAIQFNMISDDDHGPAIGDYIGNFPGLIRPVLSVNTEIF